MRAWWVSVSFIPPRDSGEGGPRGARWAGRGPSTLLLRSTTKRRVRRPLHHATRGPPPPLSRGRMQTIPVLARASRPRVLSNNDVKNAAALPVARIERSEMRVRSRSFKPHPGFRFVQSGLRNCTNQIKERKRNAGRRSIPCPHATARGARHGDGGLRRPSASGALACRRSTNGTCGSDRTPPLSSSSRTSWDGTR